MSAAAATGEDLLAAGEYTSAISAYSIAIKDSPESPNYRLQRSIAYHKVKDYVHALEDSESAIDLALARGNKSLRAKAQFRCGLALYGLGRLRDSLHYLQTAAQDGYTDKALQIWLAKVEDACSRLNADTTCSTDRPPPLMSFNELQAGKTMPPGGQVNNTVLDNEERSTAASWEPRYDWYQSQDRIVLSVYARNISRENCQIVFEDDSVLLSLVMPDARMPYIKHFKSLAGYIDVSQSSYRVLSTKIEIILFKKDNNQWSSLQNIGEARIQLPQYPTSSQSGPKDWEKLANEDDEQAEPEGDAALTHLFQTLYKDADEDTKKAMIKSYTESGGTALSTDWKSVQRKRVEVSPPDGMVAKHFND